MLSWGVFPFFSKDFRSSAKRTNPCFFGVSLVFFFLSLFKKSKGLGNKKCTRTFLHKLFEHPYGSGTSRQKSRDIPDSSLRNPRKTKFRGRARSFWPPPLRVEDPDPTGRSPDPKSLSLCSFFFPERLEGQGTSLNLRAHASGGVLYKGAF